jgi:hypothetical protein
LTNHHKYNAINIHVSSIAEWFEGIFPQIGKGIPDLEIEPFEPLGIKRISVARNTGEVVQLNGSFDNLKIRGPSNATVAKAALNLEKNYLNFDLIIPKLRINATYNLRGNILLLPLVGTGNVNILLKDIKTSIFTKISLKSMPDVSLIIIITIIAYIVCMFIVE